MVNLEPPPIPQTSRISSLLQASTKLSRIIVPPVKKVQTTITITSTAPKTIQRWLSTPAVKNSRSASTRSAFKNVLSVAKATVGDESLETILAPYQAVFENAYTSSDNDTSMSDGDGDVGDTADDLSTTSLLPSPSHAVLIAFFFNTAASLLLAQNKPCEAFTLAQTALTHLHNKHLTPSSVGVLAAFLSRLHSTKNEASERSGSEQTVGTNRNENSFYYSKSVVLRDSLTQATLLCAMLRDLLSFNLVDQAAKLASSTTFPTAGVSTNNQHCRHLYYTGRIAALQLQYSEAAGLLGTSLKKAPTNTAFSFRLAVTKLLTIVQLLMGDVPERTTFGGKDTGGEEEWKRQMAPYLEITKSVRTGDLTVFERVLKDEEVKRGFVSDGTYALITRLSHTVVKAGLRRLSLSYSKISMVDVAERLGIGGDGQSAEFVCSKAIRDGVIDAVLEVAPDGTVSLCSTEIANVYATEEPTEAFHKRIAFCLEMRNSAVKAMRYPEDAFKKKVVEKKKGGKGEEELTEEELVNEILEEEEEED